MKNGIARKLGLGVRGVHILATLMLLLGVGLNFANIIGRYLFNAPIDWAEEVMLFLMVGMVFLGAVAVSWDGRHIKMDILVNLLPQGPRKFFHLFASVGEVVVAVFIAVLAVPVIEQLAAFDQRSQAADMPLAIPQALVPIGVFLMALVTAARLAGCLPLKRGAGPEASSTTAPLSASNPKAPPPTAGTSLPSGD